MVFVASKYPWIAFPFLGGIGFKTIHSFLKMNAPDHKFLSYPRVSAKEKLSRRDAFISTCVMYRLPKALENLKHMAF